MTIRVSGAGRFYLPRERNKKADRFIHNVHAQLHHLLPKESLALRSKSVKILQIKAKHCVFTNKTHKSTGQIGNNCALSSVNYDLA